MKTLLEPMSIISMFSRVAVQNERYEDWSNVLLQLRRLFTDYQKIVLQYHERPKMEIPTAINSTAAQGNFLEVLNMSLNGKIVVLLYRLFHFFLS